MDELARPKPYSFARFYLVVGVSLAAFIGIVEALSYILPYFHASFSAIYIFIIGLPLMTVMSVLATRYARGQRLIPRL